MGLYDFSPSLLLSEFVRTYRIVHFNFDNPKHIPPKPYPPRPEHCISFYPRDSEHVEYVGTKKLAGNLKAVLFGQQTEVTNRYVGRDFLLFQIVFKPGALYRITGVPSSEITNEYLDVELFFDNDIRFVNDQLNDCSTYREMVAVIEKFLINHIKRNSSTRHRMDTLNDMLITSTGTCTVDWLAKESCLSIRQFERIFKERMGVSPKYFAKVARFENAFRMKNKSPELDWLTIALNAGYYDYQHLAKDYKDLTGQTPNDFHRLDLSAPERSFGDADTY